MAEGEDEERESIALLAPKIEAIPDGEGYGFSLPIYYGPLLSERKFLEKAEKAERAHERKTLELLKKVAAETNHSLVELATAHDNGDMSAYVEDFAPYMMEFQELEDGNPVKNRKVVAITGYMRRIVPSWQIAHTEALHESILNELVLFGTTELESVVREEGKPQVLKID